MSRTRLIAFVVVVSACLTACVQSGAAGASDSPESTLETASPAA
jgi:hypothetical protein